jgi:hypothetical protein
MRVYSRIQLLNKAMWTKPLDVVERPIADVPAVSCLVLPVNPVQPPFMAFAIVPNADFCH